MTELEEIGSPAAIARVLSAMLHALVAQEMGADPGPAFMTEFRERFADLATEVPPGVGAAYQHLFLDISGALFSVVHYVADQTDQDPRELLAHLIRTYRKAQDG